MKERITLGNTLQRNKMKEINIEELKEPSKSTIHYRTSVEVARDNYCDTLMKYLSDVNFINSPSIEEREKVLNRELDSLMCFCRNAFHEIYREY